MTGRDILDTLRSSHNKGTIELSPGPCEIKVGETDHKAAQLIKLMEDNGLLHEETKAQELIEILLSCLWWAQFLLSLPREDK